MEVVTGNQSWMAGQGKILGYPMMFWGSSWWYVVCGEACMEYENQRFLEMHWCLCWVRSHLCLEGKHVTKCVFPSWHSDQQSTKGTEKNWGCIPLTVTKLGLLRRLCLVAQSWPTLCGPMDCSPPGFSVHGDSLGKNIGVDCHALLQGKKAEHWRTDDFELWFWRRLLRVPWTARSNKSILKEINPEYSLEGLMLKLKL